MSVSGLHPLNLLWQGLEVGLASETEMKDLRLVIVAYVVVCAGR